MISITIGSYKENLAALSSMNDLVAREDYDVSDYWTGNILVRQGGNVLAAFKAHEGCITHDGNRYGRVEVDEGNRTIWVK